MSKIITSDKEITSIIETLTIMKKMRTRFRRKLCRYLRDNKIVFKDDSWITGKIELGYLGDLSDNQLIHYANHVKENKKWKLIK